MQTDLSLKELLELPTVTRERPYPVPGMTLRAKVLLGGGALCALALLIGIGWYVLTTRPLVPDVMDLDVGQAKQVAVDTGMELIVSARLYSVSPVDTVIGQYPRAGSKPLFGRTLRVVLSSGKQALTVPLLVGETELRARSILEQQGLNAQIVYEYAPDNIGKVLSTKPGAYSVVETGDIVVVRIGAPRSQIALVEYDLQSNTIILIVGNEERTAVAHDIAIRLSSLLQAAQATVFIQEEPTDTATINVRLTTGDHATDTVEVFGDDRVVGGDEGAVLGQEIVTSLKQIPLATGYTHIDWDGAMPAGTVEVSFGIDGDLSLYRDTRWKDNIARSLYLAIGRTLVR